MNNKRVETRVPAKGSISYTSATDDPVSMRAGLIINLSKSGACVLTQERITSDEMTIYMNDSLANPLKAEVLWCSENGDDLYKVGLRFS
jgi:hypothetical protein